MIQPPLSPENRSGRRSGRERRSRERRTLAIGLGLSLAVHLVAILLVSEWLAAPPESAPPSSSAIVVEPLPGTRAVELRLQDDGGDPAEPERPEQAPEPAVESGSRVVRVAASEPDAAGSEPDATPADRRTAADRLAPRVVDPRLWRPITLVPGEMTIRDVEARVAAALELLSDSALAEADAAVRARDWTVEDEKGGKWGISPGKLHLGSLVLPLPIYAVATPQQKETEAIWFELDQQLERTLILESFEERVRVIRERRERERGEARRRDNGGG